MADQSNTVRINMTPSQLALAFAREFFPWAVPDDLDKPGHAQTLFLAMEQQRARSRHNPEVQIKDDRFFSYSNGSDLFMSCPDLGLNAAWTFVGRERFMIMVSRPSQMNPTVTCNDYQLTVDASGVLAHGPVDLDRYVHLDQNFVDLIPFFIFVLPRIDQSKMVEAVKIGSDGVSKGQMIQLFVRCTERLSRDVHEGRLRFRSQGEAARFRSHPPAWARELEMARRIWLDALVNNARE